MNSRSLTTALRFARLGLALRLGTGSAAWSECFHHALGNAPGLPPCLGVFIVLVLLAGSRHTVGLVISRNALYNNCTGNQLDQHRFGDVSFGYTFPSVTGFHEETFGGGHIAIYFLAVRYNSRGISNLRHSGEDFFLLTYKIVRLR